MQQTIETSTPEEDEAFARIEAQQKAAPNSERPRFTGFEIRTWVDGIVTSQTYHGTGEIGHLNFDPPLVLPDGVTLLHGCELVPGVTKLPPQFELGLKP